MRADASPGVDAYIVCLGTEALIAGIRLATNLRRCGFRALCDLGGDRSMKAQLRSANKTGARYALILAEQEMAAGTVTCKDLMSGEQAEFLMSDVPEHLAKKSDSESRN